MMTKAMQLFDAQTTKMLADFDRRAQQILDNIRVTVMGFEIGHTVAALAPNRHDDPA